MFRSILSIVLAAPLIVSAAPSGGRIDGAHDRNGCVDLDAPRGVTIFGDVTSRRLPGPPDFESKKDSRLYFLVALARPACAVGQDSGGRPFKVSSVQVSASDPRQEQLLRRGGVLQVIGSAAPPMVAGEYADLILDARTVTRGRAIMLRTPRQ